MDFEKTLITNGYKKNTNIRAMSRQVNDEIEFIFKDKEFMIYDRHIQEFYFVSQKKYTKLSIDKLIQIFSCTTPYQRSIINNSFKIIFKSLYKLSKNYEEFQKLGLLYGMIQKTSYNNELMDINDLDLIPDFDVDMLDFNKELISDDKFEDILTTNQTVANTNQTVANQNKFTKNDFSKITEQDTKSTSSLSNGLLSIYLTENNICGLITYEWILYHKNNPRENSLRFLLGE